MTASSAKPASGEDTHDIPDEVVAIVRKVVCCTNDDRDAKSHNGIYALVRPTVGAFEKRWAEVQARVAEVSAAVTKASELKAKDRAGARAALLAVITPVPAGPNGMLPATKRDILEVRDAEVPAIDAYVDLLLEDKDWQAAIDAGAMYWTRRKVRAKADEVWIYLSAKHDKMIGDWGSRDVEKGDIRYRVYSLWDLSAKLRGVGGVIQLRTEGQNLAWQLEVKIARAGVEHTLVNIEAGKPGEWIQVKLDPTKRTDKTIEYVGTDTWRTPKNCHEGSKIDGWDGTGAPVYKVECDYDEHSRKVTFEAKLKAPLPDWAKSDEITVVGKIVSSGPTWKLTDAFVADRRYTHEL